MPRIIISDLDGTLADITHRLPYIKKDNKSKNYDAFYEACDNDEPIHEIINLLRIYKRQGYTIRIVSGRSDAVKEKTTKWLAHWDVPYDDLIMREHKDYTPDDKLKESWLYTNLLGQVEDIEFVLEDRSRMVSMWRKHGLRCLQVSHGDF